MLDHVDYYLDVITKYKSKFAVLDYSDEPTYRVILKGKKCIGQISSALLESTYVKKDYYVYEPYENGKTDEMIDSSEIFNRKSISRTIKDLEENIINQNPSIIAEYDKMFDGIELSKMKLDHQFLLNLFLRILNMQQKLKLIE